MLLGWCAGLLKNICFFRCLSYSDHTFPPHCGVIAARSLSFSATSTSTSVGVRSQPQSSCTAHGSCGTRRSSIVFSHTRSGHVVPGMYGLGVPVPPEKLKPAKMSPPSSAPDMNMNVGSVLSGPVDERRIGSLPQVTVVAEGVATSVANIAASAWPRSQREP